MRRFLRRWTMDDDRWNCGVRPHTVIVTLGILLILCMYSQAHASRQEQRLPRKRFSVVTIEGQTDRATKGSSTTGHDNDDRPIRFRTYEIERLERELGSPENNSGQPALYKSIFDLCNVTGRVTAVDVTAKRITVDLG